LKRLHESATGQVFEADRLLAKEKKEILPLFTFPDQEDDIS